MKALHIYFIFSVNANFAVVPSICWSVCFW